ncbi:MAG: hypothetical protein SGI74_09115 [Oligoflexia bacterium]|nr:hypothetical protein [Oligoflexia bacterium]
MNPMMSQSGAMQSQPRPLRPWAAKFKANPLWRLFVILTVPAFEFFWSWILHFNEKIIYLKSPYIDADSKNLKRDAIEIYKNDPVFKEFALWLKSRIPESVIQKKREEMNKRTDELAYAETLELQLDEETRLGILEFAMSAPVLNKVLPYFKIIPRIDTAFVLYNIPKPDLGGPEGSQRWHRDGDIYKMLSLYICLTDLDENSGQYSAVSERNLNYHQAIPLERVDGDKSIWKNGRHSDSYLRKFVPDSDLVHLKGPIGTAALVDSASCYHKGGFCKERERILFQINYICDQVHVRPSIVDYLSLRKNPKLSSLLLTPLQRAMVRSNAGRKGRLVFTLARRLLTYNIKP